MAKRKKVYKSKSKISSVRASRAGAAKRTGVRKAKGVARKRTAGRR